MNVEEQPNEGQPNTGLSDAAQAVISSMSGLGTASQDLESELKAVASKPQEEIKPAATENKEATPEGVIGDFLKTKPNIKRTAKTFHLL